MKTKLLPFVCGIAMISLFPILDLNLFAQTTPAAREIPTVEIPLGLRCVVTLDPEAPAKEIPVAPRRSSGFYAMNTTEGTLVRLDPEWVVLRDGSYDNWIPRAKVLIIRSSR